jgi:hypothetical protein
VSSSNLLSKLNIEIKRKFAADLESTGNSSTVAVKREKKRKEAYIKFHIDYIFMITWRRDRRQTYRHDHFMFLFLS